MDVCESKRLPLVPAENKNKIETTRRTHTRDVSSRYRSPTPSAPKRFPSPNARRLSSSSSSSSIPTAPAPAPAPKRATSAERRRPSRPSSPPYPSTPVQDTSAEMILASRKTAGSKLPESLWPSTMRSLNVSFQSDSYSIPASKKEKPVSHVPSDRTLRPSSNLTSRKPTPERKRSPLKGKNSDNHSENSKPVESLHSRQHRWPSTALNRSVDLGSKTSKISASFSHSGSGASPLRRLSLDCGASKPLVKSTSDMLSRISRDDSFSSSSGRTQLMNAAARALSNPTPGSRAPSLSVTRGISPSRTKPGINPSSRGPSPARGRPSSPSKQPPSSTSVLSFIADIKKGKKAANHIEDVHQLRMLYNRHLQWRYANARTCFLSQSQKVKAEKMLCTVWIVVADLWDTIMEKRIELQQLRLKLNLYSVLNKQLTGLDEWSSFERDHVNSLTWIIQDLQASTIRIPVTGGARGDVETLKAAICSAVDVMQAMGSSLFTILSRAVGVNSLVSELADVAAQERGMLDECESVLGAVAALQVEEYSLRTHLLQTKNALRNDEPSSYGY